MSTAIEVKEIGAPKDSAALDVVFFHGLASNSNAAWTAENGNCWPEMLARSDPRCRVWTVGYPAKPGHVFAVGKDPQPAIDKLTTEIFHAIKTGGLGKRPAVWVAHSLGGLVAKRLLMKSWQRAGKLPHEFSGECVVGLMFLGTPHLGSDGADYIKYAEKLKDLFCDWGSMLASLGDISGLIASTVGKNVLVSGPLIAYLQPDNEVRRADNGMFASYWVERRLCGRPLLVKAFAEELSVKDIKGTPRIVEPDSADPQLWVSGGQAIEAITASGCDHITIAKPESAHAQVHRALLELIDDAVQFDAVFDLGHPRRNLRAGAIFRALLVGTGGSKVRRWLVDEEQSPTDDKLLRKQIYDTVAKLVGVTEKASRIGLQKLATALGDRPPANWDAADIRRLDELVGTLAMLGYADMLLPAGVIPSASEFTVLGSMDPQNAGDRDLAQAMLELGKAAVQQRHTTNWEIEATKSGAYLLRSRSRVLSANTVADPASCVVDDHLREFEKQIHALARPNEPYSETDPNVRHQVKRWLDSMFPTYQSPLIDATSGQTAFSNELVRKELRAKHGNHVTIALPAAAEKKSLTDNERSLLNDLVEDLRRYLSARQSLNSKASIQ